MYTRIFETRLNLKVLWFNEFLGLAIDQKIENQTYPLTSYYIWPRTDAWEQLKLELDSRTWLAKEEKVKILNTTTEIINFWRINRKLEFSENLSSKFPNVFVVKIKI